MKVLIEVVFFPELHDFQTAFSLKLAMKNEKFFQIRNKDTFLTQDNKT